MGVSTIIPQHYEPSSKLQIDKAGDKFCFLTNSKCILLLDAKDDK